MLCLNIFEQTRQPNFLPTPHTYFKWSFRCGLRRAPANETPQPFGQRTADWELAHAAFIKRFISESESTTLKRFLNFYQRYNTVWRCGKVRNETQWTLQYYDRSEKRAKHIIRVTPLHLNFYAQTGLGA